MLVAGHWTVADNKLRISEHINVDFQENKDRPSLEAGLTCWCGGKFLGNFKWLPSVSITAITSSLGLKSDWVECTLLLIWRNSTGSPRHCFQSLARCPTGAHRVSESSLSLRVFCVRLLGIYILIRPTRVILRLGRLLFYLLVCVYWQHEFL